MADLDRAAATQLVYQRLANPRFRRCLKAVAPDGTKPVAVVLRDDTVSSMFDEVRARGWTCNVAVPALNGLIVIAIDVDGEGAHDGPPLRPRKLRADCTVGVFLECLMHDAGTGRQAVYELEVEGPDCRMERGRAELVALAG